MPIIIAGIVLIVFGLLAIYSVSIYESFSLTVAKIASGSMKGNPSNYYYFFKQIRNVGLAIVMAAIIYAIPIKFFQKNKNVTIIAVILMILQILVFFPGI